MGTFVVEGGHRLDGRIRPAGNKNAALPCLAATVLAGEPVTLENVPRIRDVLTFLEIVSSLGAEVTWDGPNEVTVDATGIRTDIVDGRLAKRIRASVLLAGPLLARFGRVELPPPGGDVIGRRRMDTHFLVFEALGARVDLNGGFTIQVDDLRGADLFLDEPSVTGTENAVMAAVRADGLTRLRNAAAEPHVQDLCGLLNAMGADIRGIGTHVLEIEGVSELSGARFRIGADHIETGSFIGLAAVTGSDLVIEDAPVEHLNSTLLGFRRLGIDCDVQGSEVHVHGSEEHHVQTDAFGQVPKLDDGPWPAFPADLTSIALVGSDAVSRHRAHPREDVRIAYVLYRQARRHGSLNHFVRSAPGGCRGSEPPSGWGRREPGHPGGDGSIDCSARRGRDEPDPQHPADRARIRGDR